MLLLNKRYSYLNIFLLLVFVFSASIVQAGLMISPTRVVLDEKTRTTEVTLLNTTKETKTYRILLEDKRQKLGGGYVELGDAGESEFSAANMIRFSPRKITIQPGKYQKIKLRLRAPDDLKVGEYRSHLKMKIIDSGVEVDTSVEPGQGFKAIIIPMMSFSIPVMVRKGPMVVKTDIERLSLDLKKPKEPKLLVNITREGDYSSFGNLEVYMKSPSGEISNIGKSHNIALFRETPLRQVSVPLKTPKIPKGAAIQVLYKGDDEFTGQTLGKATFRYSP